MTNQEIIDNAPDGAEYYIEHNGYLRYFKLKDGVYLVWFKYDVADGWAVANHKFIKDNSSKLKPLK